MLDPDGAARVFNTMRKLFTAQSFTIQQETRIKSALRQATDEGVATDAVGRLYAEGITWPTEYHVRGAIRAEHRRREEQAPPDYGEGPFVSFADWFALQDVDMQARVRRVFPSLKPEDAARAIHGGTA